MRPDLLRGSVDFGGRQDFVKWKCPNATFGSCEDRQQTDRNEDHDRLLRFNCCDHETDQRTEDRHSTGDRQQHCQADYSFEGEEEEDHPTEKDREFRDENARFPGSQIRSIVQERACCSHDDGCSHEQRRTIVSDQVDTKRDHRNADQGGDSDSEQGRS